jgi:hypothetical protein
MKHTPLTKKQAKAQVWLCLFQSVYGLYWLVMGIVDKSWAYLIMGFVFLALAPDQGRLLLGGLFELRGDSDHRCARNRCLFLLRDADSGEERRSIRNPLEHFVPATAICVKTPDLHIYRAI